MCCVNKQTLRHAYASALTNNNNTTQHNTTQRVVSCYPTSVLTDRPQTRKKLWLDCLLSGSPLLSYQLSLLFFSVPKLSLLLFSMLPKTKRIPVHRYSKVSTVQYGTATSPVVVRGLTSSQLSLSRVQSQKKIGKNHANHNNKNNHEQTKRLVATPTLQPSKQASKAIHPSIDPSIKQTNKQTDYHKQ